ncbi:MAG: ABC transporter permease [Lachnospiraceae bacterium]
MKDTFVSFRRQWRAEKQKSRRRYIWSIPAIFWGFEFLWALWQLSTASSDDMRHGYTMLLYNLPMLNVILLPIMCAVIASRLCDMEIKGDTLKLLYTMQKRTVLYDCKYLLGLKYLALFSLGQGALLPLCGMLYPIREQLDPVQLAQSVVVVFTVSALVLCVQQFLSMHSRSQILPLVTGLAGSFLGLFSMFFPADISRLILWGYYAAFSVIGMNWDAATRYIEYYDIAFPAAKFAVFLCFTVAAYLVTRTFTAKKEV